jgi:murein DD-endopeptidase MepM/ murein hydrolase activator NlpD
MRRRIVISLLAAVLVASIPGLALGLDDYTLPFYDPAIKLSYGMDREPMRCVQLDYTGTLHRTCDPVLGRVYDNHLGLDYPMSIGTRVAAARGGKVIDLVENLPTNGGGFDGNYVLLEHSDGRRTLYYHLANNGVVVNKGQSVVAGQHIGNSGCSGLCYGAHLHFEMWVRKDGQWLPRDPMFEQRWTTWPGRVPFRGTYVRESNAGTIKLKRYTTVKHWVEFRNDGGRTWSNASAIGRLYLATWDPGLRSSAFQAADWLSAGAVSLTDEATVAPGKVGRFSFSLYAAPAPGKYTEKFNLLANQLFWFDYNLIGKFYLPIEVTTSTQTPLSDPR